MLIISALIVLALWLVIAIVLIGLGFTILSRFHKNLSLGDAFWMGLALSVAFLEIWSLVAPVDSAAAISLFLIGLLGFLFNRVVVTTWVQKEWQASRGVILSAALIAAFLALRACAPCDYYDTGLYGAPAVRWILTYPAVPGLANLHGRLGFNSSAFLCVAVLNTSSWKDLGIHLFPGFIMAAMSIAILRSCVRLIGTSPLTPADWFRGILVIPVVFWATRSKLVGTLTDEPASIACLVGASILFDMLCFQRENGQLPHAVPNYARIVVAMTLFSLGVALKTSTIAFALLAWCLALGWLWRMARANKKSMRVLTVALTISSLILLPWCARGIILSGYPVFPAAALGVSADWRVPAPVAKMYAEGVRSWGRNPDAVSVAETQGTGWVKGWVRHAIRDRASLQVPAAISLGGFGTGLVMALRRKRVPPYSGPATRLRKKGLSQIGPADFLASTVPNAAWLGSADLRKAERVATCPWLWLLLPSLAGVVFWFWASPDPRFGQFSIWTMAATLGTWGIVSFIGPQQSARVAEEQAVTARRPEGDRSTEPQSLRADDTQRLAANQQSRKELSASGAEKADDRPRLVSLGKQRVRMRLAAGAILALAVWCLAGYGWREPYRRLLAEGGLTPLPQPAVTARKTLSGLTVYVPAEGNQCWDAPLPCTPYFDPTLRLRDQKSMRWGFASEGKPEF